MLNYYKIDIIKLFIDSVKLNNELERKRREALEKDKSDVKQLSKFNPAPPVNIVKSIVDISTIGYIKFKP